jgi:hypothetical protein
MVRGINPNVSKFRWPAALGQLVEHSTHDPKFKGSNPVSTGTGRKPQSERKKLRYSARVDFLPCVKALDSSAKIFRRNTPAYFAAVSEEEMRFMILTPGANCMKLFTAVIYNFSEYLECLALASLASLV